MLEWKNQLATTQYTSYFIERSVDGANYQTINEVPFIYSVDEKAKATVNNILYKDLIPENGIDYYYRLKGVSPFGIHGPMSEPVIGRGIPGRLDIILNARIALEEDDQIIIAWDGISSEQADLIDKIEVLRSLVIHDEFENISGQSLTPSDQQYIDSSPLYNSYYVVSAIDKNGHHYSSRTIFAQPSDDTPPAIPSGLAATADKNGSISINWNSNTDVDLAGYRVFRSNLRTGNFVDISKQDVTSAVYQDQLTTDMLTDSVFYAVISADIRGNHSEFSEIIALARPNDIPPSAALLFNLTPTMEGMRIAWELSGSADVAFHILQRKPKDRVGWDDVEIITPDSPLANQQFGDDIFKYNYIDLGELDQIVYQYRIAAYDVFQNYSVSNMLEITPLFNNLEGEIFNLTAQAICGQNSDQEVIDQVNAYQTAYQDIQNNPQNANTIILNLLQTGIITYNQYAALLNNSNGLSTALSNQIGSLNGQLSTLSCQVIISCLYKTDQAIDYLELYRAKNNESLELYRTYRAESLIQDDQIDYEVALIDDDVEQQNRYTYKILFFVKGGIYTSPLSDEVLVLIEE
jgi:hypothetical protein